MSTMQFSDDTARRLEALYRTKDIVAQREATLDVLDLRAGYSVIDLGSGPGFLCEQLADQVGSRGSVLGVDISADLVQRALERKQCDWLDYQVADVTALPQPDHRFDAAVCIQVAEYITDINALLSETLRVLKPGGRAVFVATDWDGVIWHSENPVRMAAVLKSWETHCADPRLPRTLGQKLADRGFALNETRVFPILNTGWEENCYSRGISLLIRDFVIAKGEMPPSDVNSWYEELARLSAEGSYFFSSNRYIFLVTAP